MPDQTAEFFDELGRRGHEPLLGRVTATIRFDLEREHGVDHWLLTITRGDLRITRENRDANAVIRTTKALFDRFVTGEAYMYAAWVRNELILTGDLGLGRLFQRIVPGRPGAHHPRAFARERSRRA